ncbi:MAG: hypothetical protein GWN62_23050, partial [Aliifodinibius sp.]|nr:hypothetical protein [Fodinibius sp.]NIW79253.1 hypothetical protein [Calditrichia bacterium]
MQWKLGYFDGQKNRVAILPISETDFASDEYKPQDYLGIYPYVAKGCPENSTTETLWIHETAKKYVVFDWWLKGIDPVDPFTRDRLTS